MLGNIIAGFVLLIVGVTLLPKISEQVNVAQANLTGSPSSLIGLTTIFFALAIMVAAISIAAQPFLKGSEDKDEDDEEIKPELKPEKKKQSFWMRFTGVE